MNRPAPRGRRGLLRRALGEARFVSLSAALAGVAPALLSAVPAWAAEPETRTLTQSAAIPAGGSIELRNLAGRVEIATADGAAASLEARVHAEGGSAAESRALAEAVSLAVREEGTSRTVVVRYPLDAHDTFVYPDPERHRGFLGSLGLTRSMVRYEGRSVTVVSAERRRPVLYVDVTLRVPKGVAVTVRNEVGRVTGRGVASDLTVETAAADVKIADAGGDVRIDTGSGDVAIRGAAARTLVNTGSGDVVVERAAAGVSVETGSGDVRVARAEAGARVHTGSGEIRLSDVAGPIDLGTGSGDVTGERLAARGSVSAETGSGNVSLAGRFAAVERASIHTASGDVSLVVDDAPAFDVRVRTTSGEIDVDLAGLRRVAETERRFEATAGVGGASLAITTSSGNVTVRRG